MKQRSSALDFIRVIGIVAVVAGHIWDTPLVREALYTWHVPVFFVLSGYLWTSNRTMWDEIRNRWRTIGVPYLAWLLILAVPFLITTARREGSVVGQAVRVLAGGAYIGRPFSAFWFLTSLAIACLIFRLLQRFHIAVTWVVALVGVAACTIAPSAMSKIPLAGGVSLAALTFLLIGQLVRTHRDRLMRPVTTALVLLVASAALIITGLARPLDMKQAMLGTPVVSLVVAAAISVALILLSESLFKGRSGWFPSAIIELAVAGTVVILTHAAVLWVLGTPPVGSFRDFALAIVIPWAAGLLIVRTPLRALLAGTPRRSFAARRMVAPQG